MDGDGVFLGVLDNGGEARRDRASTVEGAKAEVEERGIIVIRRIIRESRPTGNDPRPTN